MSFATSLFVFVQNEHLTVMSASVVDMCGSSNGSIWKCRRAAVYDSPVSAARSERAA